MAPLAFMLALGTATAARADLEPGFTYRTPAVAQNADGRLILFASDGTDRVWLRTETAPASGTWSAWSQLGGRMRALAAATNTGGRIEVFGLDAAGRIWHRWQRTPGGIWNDWSQLDGTLASIAVARNGAGQLEIFGANAANQIWHRTQTAPGANNWTPWVSEFGLLRAVAAAPNADGQVELSGIDSSGRVWYRPKTPAGAWLDWEILPGATLTSIAVDGTDVYGTTSAGRIVHSARGAWTSLPGRSRSVAVAADRPELLGLDNLGRAFQRTGGGWEQIPGNLAPVAGPSRISRIDAGTTAVTINQAVAIGADGLALVSYLDHQAGTLRVAHCVDVACTAATSNVVDSVGEGGYGSSVAIGPDGLAVISYLTTGGVYEPGSGVFQVKVAHCQDVACTTATVKTVDPGVVAPTATAVVIGGDGLPLVGYMERRDQGRPAQFVLAHCGDLDCSRLSGLVTRDAGDDTVPALAVGPDGLAVAAWADAPAGHVQTRLRVGRCGDPLCGSMSPVTSIETGMDRRGASHAIAIGADGATLVSYRTPQLMLARCGATASTAGCTSTMVDAGTDQGASAVQVGDDGLPVVIYHDFTNRLLRAAHCSAAACGATNKATITNTGHSASFAATIGTDGLPLVVFADFAYSDLMAAHCGNALCTGF